MLPDSCTRCPGASPGSASKKAITRHRTSAVDLQNCIPKSTILDKLPGLGYCVITTPSGTRPQRIQNSRPLSKVPFVILQPQQMTSSALGTAKQKRVSSFNSLLTQKNQGGVKQWSTHSLSVLRRTGASLHHFDRSNNSGYFIKKPRGNTLALKGHLGGFYHFDKWARLDDLILVLMPQV